MKTVRILQDFDYRVGRKWVMAFKAGSLVGRVPEAAAAAILTAGAGELVAPATLGRSDLPDPKNRRAKWPPAR